jgi:hypothetical protein
MRKIGVGPLQELDSLFAIAAIQSHVFVIMSLESVHALEEASLPQLF